MKKILSLALVLSMLLSAMSVFATGVSGIEVGRHTESDVINIEGQIEFSQIIKGEKVTVLLLNENGTPAYVEELTPDYTGKYGVKFYCEADDNAIIKIKYNGKDVSETLTIAEINGKSTLMEATIILLNERGTLFDKDGKEEMVVHDEFKTKTLKLSKTYQSMFKDTGTEADKKAQAYIKVKNAYGLDESYTPILAFYGDNNKLLDIKVYDIVEVNFEDKSKTTYTDTVDLPEGTTRVKAFAWDKDKLIPFGDSNEGKLDKIQVILVGSSAAQTWMGTATGAYPGEGYGLLLGDFFNADVVDYYNMAVSGASAGSYFLGKRGNWNSAETGKPNGVIDVIKAGNAKGMKSYVIIELGGNDIKGTYYPGWETASDGITGTFTEEYYKEYLMRMYNEVAELGGQVYFSNSSGPLNGSPYDSNGNLRTSTYGQFKIPGDNGKPFTVLPNSGREEASEYRRDLAELTGTPYIDAVPEIYDNYNYMLYEVFDKVNNDPKKSLDDLRGYYLRDTRYMVMSDTENYEGFDFPVGWGLDSEDAVLDSGNTGTSADNYYQDFSHTNLRGADMNAYYLYKAFLESDCELKFYMR